MSEETVPEAPKRKIHPTREQLASRKKIIGSHVPKKYLNPILVSFRHIKGKLIHVRCIKHEKAPGYHCLTMWKNGFIWTQWLPETDWFVKEKPLSPERLAKEVAALPTLGMTEDGPTVVPAKEEPPPKPAAPTESYPILEVRKNAAAAFSGMETVAANAEANFARQEADRKIALARHAAELRAQNTVSLGRSVTAGWEQG